MDRLHDQRNGKRLQYAPGQERGGSTRRRVSFEATVEAQTNDGQPVLCLVWHHAPISRRRGGTTFYETVERAEYLAPARTASHDPIGGGRGIRHGGGNQSQLGADTKPSRSPAGFCTHTTLLLESEPRLHER